MASLKTDEDMPAGPTAYTSGLDVCLCAVMETSQPHHCFKSQQFERFHQLKPTVSDMFRYDVEKLQW